VAENWITNRLPAGQKLPLSHMTLLPLFHMACFVCVMSYPPAGWALNLCGDIRDFYRDLGLMHSDVMASAPMLVETIYNDYKRGRVERLNGLWDLCCSSAALDPKMLLELAQNGFVVNQCYGMTETFGDGILNFTQVEKHMSAVGKPDDHVQYKLDETGEICIKGDCVMRATQVGADTVLSQIAAMVARAQATKAPVQQLADKIARYFVPAVMIIAIWTFAIWVSLGPAPQLAHALVTAVSVLIIACPCALGLATPLSVTVSLGLGATNGVLVTSAKALEQARRIGTVVFDKTGTITRGVVDAAADWDKPSYEQDTVKEGSREAVAALRARGIRTVMLSGDKAEVAGRIAREVGIDTVICEVKPDGKAYWIAKLQRERDEDATKSAYGTSRTAAQSRTLIAMVGDGINDAPALAQADLGIAIGTGTDVAMQSADVTLMSGDLRGVIKTINLSNATMRNIRENLGWAFGYNVIGIPVAAGVLYPFTGWLLSPMIAGLAMALSSVCLVLNANRLHGANINVGAADGPAGSGSSMADVESAGSAESANAANITGSATSNAPHEPTVIIDDRTTLNQTNHVSDQSNNPTNKENTMDMGMHMHHTAPADGETATDPVCGMTVAVNADAITREYEGKSYYFCGEHCATNFMKAPQVFLEQ